MANDRRSITRLFGDAVGEFAQLVRSEMAVAKAELFEKITQAGTGAGLLVGAALVFIPTLTLVLLALASWLSELGLRGSAAHLIAAGFGLALTLLLAFLGVARLAPRNLRPTRSLEEIDRDVSALKRVL
jgi:hypothetical protein